MATRRKVSCINKSDGDNEAHERISHIGGINADGSRWRKHEDEAKAGIVNDTMEFYVSVNGKSVGDIVAKHNGRNILKPKRTAIVLITCGPYLSALNKRDNFKPKPYHKKWSQSTSNLSTITRRFMPRFWTS